MNSWKILNIKFPIGAQWIWIFIYIRKERSFSQWVKILVVSVENKQVVLLSVSNIMKKSEGRERWPFLEFFGINYFVNVLMEFEFLFLYW